MKSSRISSVAVSVLGIAFCGVALAVNTPEQETLEISKLLKPIDDDQWKLVAGNHVSESYAIVQGDTLYDLSKRLFGDPKYWPKIWALNNQQITNPHLILPGNQVTFMPGTGTSLPALAIQEQGKGHESPDQTESHAHAAQLDAESPEELAEAAEPKALIADRYGRSNEWRKLPRQSWESVTIQLPPSVDPNGFDRNNKLSTPKSTGFDLPILPASDPIEGLGTITGSDRAGIALSLDDTAFITASSQLEVGQTYAVIGQGIELDHKNADHEGYVYPVLGKVKITEKKTDLYVGVVTENTNPMPRGSTLIAVPAHIPEINPIPGPSPIEATLLIDNTYSTSMIAQHKLVFIDQGTENGVQTGMLFRTFRHDDPSTGKLLTEENMVPTAEVMVVYTTPKISAAIVTRSSDTIEHGDRATLLTDLSEVNKKIMSPSKSSAPEALPVPSHDEDLDNTDDESTDSGAGTSTEPEALPVDGDEKDLELEDSPKEPEAAPSPSAIEKSEDGDLDSLEAPAASPEDEPTSSIPAQAF